MSYNILEMFGCKVFSDDVMRRRLPKDVYEDLKLTNREGKPLNPSIADCVATVMKEWAVENGATHYSHWFQPMTGVTAGKLDSFIDIARDGKIILKFSGKALAQGEPDASSFPNGGLRNTFEARGYTAWDPTSPAFLRGTTLYIPTAFCSYTGEALDTKTPLLRSMEAVSKEALRVLRMFGNSTVKRVVPTVGAEQEYFLVDREYYEKRLDLKVCGRTLLGAKPPKGQELDDHYCGRIRIRVSDFMRQLDEELWNLGVTAKTKHNEAAPAQHELAPLFCSANIACDHNQLIMETMRTVAKRNGLACLLHEKPFEGVNGSGKHNNWSLSTDDGANLLEPGKTPYENLQFLVFLCAVITAVDKHQDLLRLSAASAGNDHRLGANEAPPAIISIFLGDQLTSILYDIAHGAEHTEDSAGLLQTGVSTLPSLPRDMSDRNRTSPFAFTGNRFEFRMVGSSASVAPANYMLNTIVAESLSEFADRLESSDDFDGEIKHIIADTIKKHGRIIFNGNNYSDEWVQEAEKRGLLNLKDTVSAITTLTAKKNTEMFERFGVFSEAECFSRYEISLEIYSKIVLVEAATMLDMASKQILPACISFAGKTAFALNQLMQASLPSDGAFDVAHAAAKSCEEISALTQKLRTVVADVNSIEEPYKKAAAISSDVTKAMAELRAACDAAETVVSSADWPIPTYSDLIYKV